MKHYLFVASLIVPFCLLADEPKPPKKFEITKQNCNLPMKKVRELLPNPADQREAMKRCMEKAVKERWKRQNTLLSEQ